MADEGFEIVPSPNAPSLEELATIGTDVNRLLRWSQGPEDRTFRGAILAALGGEGCTVRDLAGAIGEEWEQLIAGLRLAEAGGLCGRQGPPQGGLAYSTHFHGVAADPALVATALRDRHTLAPGRDAMSAAAQAARGHRPKGTGRTRPEPPRDGAGTSGRGD